jgi:hypothetical protein
MGRSPNSRDDKGVAAIEFVLVAPFLFLILFATTFMGGYMSAKTRTVGAARDYARYEALLRTGPAPVVPTGVSLTLETAGCPPRTDPTFNTRDVRVRAEYDFDFPSYLPVNGHITERATMRCGG